MASSRCFVWTALTLLVAAGSLSVPAQQPAPVSQALFSDMRWRNIGPFRAGRTKAAAGHPSLPYTFYIGVCNGGGWKTTDAGRTWKPIFDDQPTRSIGWGSGALPHPHIIYVGGGGRVARPGPAPGGGRY